MIDIKDAQQKLETWAADLERGIEVYIAPKALRKIAAALATPQPAQRDQEYSEAANLATALFRKHFAHEEPYASGQVVWGLCDSTAGVISQIDNMVSGLVKPQEPKPAPRDEPTPQAVPVAWLHPANAFCVTTDPTAYARGIPLIPRQLLEQHQAAHAAEVSRLRKIEAEWAALSQDEGKARREIARLHDRIKELSWDVEYLTQQNPSAHQPTEADVRRIVQVVETECDTWAAWPQAGAAKRKIVAAINAAAGKPGVAKLPAARFTEHGAVTVRYDLSPSQVEGAIKAKLISVVWTPPPPNVAKTPGEPS